MSAEVLAAIAGIVLSLALSYIPGLNTAYAKLDSVWKRVILLVLLVLVAGVAFWISCEGWGSAWGVTVECSQAGAQALISAFVLALIGSQSAYVISPETEKVKAAKASRG